MATRFPGASTDDAQKFHGEAIATLREDPNPSRYGAITIDEDFCRRLATEGQLEPVLVRKDSQGEPVLFVGRRRRAHILHINANLERYGLSAPMPLKFKFIPVTKEAAEELGISENLEREDLSTVDRAALAQRYAVVLGKDADWIATRLRVTRARVKQLLDLYSFGGDVLDLIAAGKLTESAVRGLRGLSEEVVADIVAQIKGGAKAHAVLAEIRRQHREKGRPRPRTGREIGKAFEDLGGGIGADLTAWWKGDPTVGDLPTILARYQR